MAKRSQNKRFLRRGVTLVGTVCALRELDWSAIPGLREGSENPRLRSCYWYCKERAQIRQTLTSRTQCCEQVLTNNPRVLRAVVCPPSHGEILRPVLISPLSSNCQPHSDSVGNLKSSKLQIRFKSINSAAARRNQRW
jgi:hypothetical protein